MFAVYFNNVEQGHIEDRIVCDDLEKAKVLVDKVVVDNSYFVSAWKGAVYPLGNEPQEGSPFNQSDLSQCIYQQGE